MNAASELKDIFEHLTVHWQTAQESWKDSVQASFAQEFWNPLEKETLITIREMEGFEILIQKIKSTTDADTY